MPGEREGGGLYSRGKQQLWGEWNWLGFRHRMLLLLLVLLVIPAKAGSAKCQPNIPILTLTQYPRSIAPKNNTGGLSILPLYLIWSMSIIASLHMYAAFIFVCSEDALLLQEVANIHPFENNSMFGLSETNIFYWEWTFVRPCDSYDMKAAPP